MMKLTEVHELSWWVLAYHHQYHVSCVMFKVNPSQSIIDIFINHPISHCPPMNIRPQTSSLKNYLITELFDYVQCS